MLVKWDSSDPGARDVVDTISERVMDIRELRLPVNPDDQLFDLSFNGQRTVLVPTVVGYRGSRGNRGRSDATNPVTVEVLMVVVMLAGALSILGSGANAKLQLATLIVPNSQRGRYMEEWTAELEAMDTRSRVERGLWVVSLLLTAIPRIAITVRLSAWLDG